MNKQPYDEASTVTAENGEVHLDGPDGVAVSLTPEAAAETSDRLLAGAAKGAGQRVNADRERDGKRQKEVR
ncbi:MAG: hypothetical protein JWR80_695 [Bradyrhizobium sp.]|nr:hypothetical protein [Bradyrhizobium sp.]